MLATRPLVADAPPPDPPAVYRGPSIGVRLLRLLMGLFLIIAALASLGLFLVVARMLAIL